MTHDQKVGSKLQSQQSINVIWFDLRNERTWLMAKFYYVLQPFLSWNDLITLTFSTLSNHKLARVSKKMSTKQLFMRVMVETKTKTKLKLRQWDCSQQIFQHSKSRNCFFFSDKQIVLPTAQHKTL